MFSVWHQQPMWCSSIASACLSAWLMSLGVPIPHGLSLSVCLCRGLSCLGVPFSQPCCLNVTFCTARVPQHAFELPLCPALKGTCRPPGQTEGTQRPQVEQKGIQIVLVQTKWLLEAPGLYKIATGAPAAHRWALRGPCDAWKGTWRSLGHREGPSEDPGSNHQWTTQRGTCRALMFAQRHSKVPVPHR